MQYYVLEVYDIANCCRWMLLFLDISKKKITATDSSLNIRIQFDIFIALIVESEYLHDQTTQLCFALLPSFGI